jgi:iron complex outermembrane receptor protein
MNMSSTTHACSQHKSSRIMSRGSSVALAVFLMTIALTACIRPVKPVPTQQSQEAPPPPTEIAEAPKPVEPAPSEAPPPPPATLPVPLPPMGMGQPTAPQAKEEIPVIEAKPVLIVAQQESSVAPSATSGTKTDTPIMDTPLNVQVVTQQVLRDQ